ncbi:PucR family transcriptional regulator [Virgibacillus sp. W0430]|uniref:PucR family transcriptional regulator n=1 Tax=Virgibacillus sp. W0430 TaxID=3391580 RepID=UPI003F45367C
MTMTVQDILELPVVKSMQGNVRTGHELLRKNKVEWVSSLEGPVENFVRENEFILTAGVECAKDLSKLLVFIKDVYTSGASALGIAMGHHIIELPKEVVDFATKNNFIIIEFPWEIRFADVQRQAAEKLNSIQHTRHGQGQERMIQKKFIDSVVQGKDLSELIFYLENKLGWSVVYKDTKGRIKYGKSNPDELLSLWGKLELDTKVDNDDLFSAYIHTLKYNNKLLVKKQISSGLVRSGEGYFIILFKEGDELDDSKLQILENLSAATAFWISRENAIVQTEIRLRNEFISDIIKHPDLAEDERVCSQAILLGYNLELPYICIVGYSNNFFELSESRYKDLEHGTKSIIYYMGEEIHYAARMVRKQVALSYDGKYLIVFLQSDADDDTLLVNQFLDVVDKRLHTLLPGVDFWWGFGKHDSGIKQFYNSHKKAKVALKMGLERDMGHRVSFEDTQLNRVILNLVDNEEIRSIAYATISPLIEYDKKREMDLIKTFIIYEEQKGNSSKAARILNLHSNDCL